VPLPFVLLSLLLAVSALAVRLPDAVVSPVCVGCRAGTEHARDTYSADEWGALMGGKVLTSEAREARVGEAERSTVQAAGIIHHRPEQVWAVLTDFESRPAYLSSTKEVRIVRVDGNRVWLAERLRFFLVDVRYQVINTLEPELGSVRWVLDDSVAHDIGGTTGSWQLTPLADAQNTLLVYRAWIDTGRSVPSFVETFLLKRSLPEVIDSLRGEVNRRFNGGGQ
jgi:uncharacterized protein YndB with AHSA1/START domain